MSMKAAVRKEVKAALKAVTDHSVEIQSAEILNRLLSLPTFQTSRSICAYLNMKGEVSTQSILEYGFNNKKIIYIPKIVGKKSEDMFMLNVLSMTEIEKFPKNSWGIPEPPMEAVLQNLDGTSAGTIDLVIVPGVAFDRNCGRMGHGKGYYGKLSVFVVPFQS
jgi:5-formyltetrahydrofolate cyclo-ligase